MKTKTFLCAFLVAGLSAFAEEDHSKHDHAKVPPASGTNAVQNAAPRWPVMKTQREKASYAIGFDMAGYHMQHKDMLDMERMIQGFRDAFESYKPMMDYAEAKELMEKFETEANAAEKRKTDQESVQNRRLGAKFLEENQKKEGIKVTPSGLQYKVVKEGNGAKPTLTDRIRFHYVVKNIAGETLDDSHRLPKPVGTSLHALMKGWQEGLQMMKEGSVYEFYVPSNLAYGEQGAGRNIKGNETLITVLELVNIEK